MKTTKIILSVLCAFLLNVQTYAQFNTIGTYNHKRIKTANPPKPTEAPTDSILMSDSISESVNYEIVGESNAKQVEDVASLVSLPLKNIHIGS